jgi:Fe-S cluster assembly iron-binding protein IscA
MIGPRAIGQGDPEPIERRTMLTLTDSAREMVRDMVEAGNAPEGSGLRIASARNENGEPALALELATQPADGDQVVDEGGTRVFLEPEVADLLDDKVLDAQRHDDHYHFSLGDQT